MLLQGRISLSDLPEANPLDPHPEWVAWSNDHWIPQNEASLALDDRGLMQGAVLVERLRTCQLEPLDVPQHMSRLISGCESLGIRLPDAWDLESLLQDVARRNAQAFHGRDFSLVVLVTPGRISIPGPTLLVHAAAIDWQRLAGWYKLGQDLVVSTTANVPSACWSPQLKTRSRLHYFLADRFAAEYDWGGSGVRAGAGAVLPDTHGNLTETSTANLLIVESGRVISPRLEHILHGVSLKRTLRLARAAGLGVAFESIPAARASAADELLLCGSTGFLWSAKCLGSHEFSDPPECGVLAVLRQAWMDELGLDYVQQADAWGA